MTLTLFTLDTCCVIDLDVGRPAAPAVEALREAHHSGQADVAILAMSASENKIGGGQLATFAEFEARLIAIGLESLTLIYPLCIYDVTFWDACLWAGDGDDDALAAISKVLFPGQPLVTSDPSAGFEPGSEAERRVSPNGLIGCAT